MNNKQLLKVILQQCEYVYIYILLDILSLIITVPQIKNMFNQINKRDQMKLKYITL